MIGPVRLINSRANLLSGIRIPTFCDEAVRDSRIVRVYSNDGPGFKREVAEGENIRAILPKVIKFLPDASIVGILLAGGEERRFIRSSEKGVAQHDPYSWSVMGTRFAAAESRSALSVFIEDTLSVWLSSLDDDRLRTFVDVFFDSLTATGAVTLHPMAGFGGGRKAIVPGVAGLETINRNHVLALSEKPGEGCNPNATTAKLEGNPFHEDLMECVEFVDPDFLLDVVLTSEGGLYEVVAGNWKTAFYQGCKDLLEISGIPVKELADVVIASGGGYPKDINLYQGTKSHMNVDLAVKPGGIAIIMLECPDIREPAVFTDWLIKSDLEKTEQEVRDNFYMAAFVAYKSRCIIEAHTVYLVTRKENFDFVRKTGQIPVETVAEAWQLAQEKLAAEGKTDYTITLMGHAPVTLPVLTI